MRSLLILLSFITFSFHGLVQAENKLDLRLFQDIRVKMATSHGDITLELFPKKAPATVKNFLRYVDTGFYNNTIFHRVIKGFMNQGGGFTTKYQLKPAHKTIKNESDNGLKNTIGTIAMARTSEPHSATSQFFINTGNNDNLDMVGDEWGYAVFGRVVEGMKVVEDINNAATGPAGPFDVDAPQGLIVIKSITVIEQKNTKSEKSSATIKKSQ